VPRGSLRIAARIEAREVARMYSPSESSSFRPNSSSIAARRRVATSLQETRPSRSPRTCIGSRTLPMMMANSVSFGLPRPFSSPIIIFMCGT